MIKILISFAPNDNSLNKICDDIASNFEKNQQEVKILSAKSTTMPDLSASDIVILCSAKENSNSVHSDFKEIRRSLKGINLAGRVAGLLSFSSEDVTKTLTSDFKDSDISVFPDSINIDVNNINIKSIKDWVQGLIKFYGVKQNERI